jgi:hypothetical protein
MNLSTGASIVCNKVPSKDSLAKPSKKAKNSRSRTQNKAGVAEDRKDCSLDLEPLINSKQNS